METLTEILKGPGAKLTELECKTKGADLCIFARHLALCPRLTVSGTLEYNGHRRVGNPVPSPVTGAKVGTITLDFEIARGWIASVPGPLNVARYLKGSLPPGSKIIIENGYFACGDDFEKLWKTTLRMTLETLEDDDKRGKAQAEDAAQPV